MKPLAPTNDFQLGNTENHSEEECVPVEGSSSSSSSKAECSNGKETNTLINFISQMLMEEDLENKPCMLHDLLALQATEKSFYDALTNNLDQDSDNFAKSCCVINNSGNPSVTTTFVDALNNDLDKSFSDSMSLGHDSEPRNKTSGDYSKMVSDRSPGSSGLKKNHSREDSDLIEHHRSNKQLANNINEESEPLETYDGVLICSNSDCPIQRCSETARFIAKQKSQQNEQSKGGPNRRRKKKSITLKESVDLRSLLMQCAQAISNFDNKTLNHLLSEIRQHSSPRGDGVERVAHYFANALEARLSGTGIAIYTAFESKKRSTIEILKAYKLYVISCPFMHMSNIMANKTIGNLARGAKTLHIIDFGILYGFQWPCLIHALSEMPGGPPKLRITGIDFPQPGFRPAERVEDTCRRLAMYGERFGVPFEYNAIAQKWDTITLEDLKIEENEVVVVNSMYRLHNVPEVTEAAYSPRDAVLNLIKRINPNMFIHGVTNGHYNSPFFVTRFKVAFFHFSTMFDMFEATIPRDDKDRQLYEDQFFGKEALNIIACEGTERVECPETYKYWEGRTVRVGLQQVPIDQETVKRMSKVKKDYHENFSVDEDGKWILLGWKGRVIQAFSCWRPIHN
ncbi:hypothetical protein CASFOL_002847 [Castilleja foliolosa]|uniref:GRAS family transcription factor n=1 Tax=Castilleja foliolosa TaxID=1961234 RepID=A0ABD3EFT3_9LAMI